MYFTDQISGVFSAFLIFNPFSSKKVAPITPFIPMLRFWTHNCHSFTTWVTLNLLITVHTNKRTIICRQDQKKAQILQICSIMLHKKDETFQKLQPDAKLSLGISSAINTCFLWEFWYLCILQTRYRAFLMHFFYFQTFFKDFGPIISYTPIISFLTHDCL